MAEGPKSPAADLLRADLHLRAPGHPAPSGYLWGEEETLDEPALGVHPLKGSLGLRYEHPGGRFFAETTVEAVGDMEGDPVPEPGRVFFRT